MRIGWLISGDESTGDAQMVRGLAGAMRGRGHAPIILSLGDGRLCRDCEQRGLETLRLGLPSPAGFGGAAPLRPLAYWRSVRLQRREVAPFVNAARTAQLDALHIIWPNMLVLAGEAARTLGIPCIWEVQNILSSRYPFKLNQRLLQRLAAKYHFTILAMSSMVAQRLGERPVRPVLFYLGADERRFTPEAADPTLRGQFEIPEGTTTIGMFARLVPEKACDRVIEALARLRSSRPDLHLLLVGGPLESPHAQLLRSLAARLGLGAAVHMVGAVSDPERYYGAIDIVASVRIDPEPFGLAVVEAMLMRKPVLAHALGGPSETVVDGITGWHIHDASVDSITAGLARAMAERSRWNEMGEAARTRALERFSLARQAEQYLMILKEICD